MFIYNVVRNILRVLNKITFNFYIIFNRVKCRLIGVQFGKHLRIYNYLYITLGQNAKIDIGNNFTFTSGGGINPLSCNKRGQIFAAGGAKISIGDNSGISSSCLWAKEKITIGNYVNIGGDCIIIDTDAHNLDWKIRGGLFQNTYGVVIEDGASAKTAPITIEDHAFIGTRSIILKGVTIGARSIIAAGSVVTKSIPPDCIAGGNPCKVIREMKQL